MAQWQTSKVKLTLSFAIVYTEDIMIGERTQDYADIGTHYFWLFDMKKGILEMMGF